MTASRHSPGLLFTTLYGAALRLTPWSESPFQHVTRARLGALGAGRVTWASLRSAGGRRSRDIPRSRRLHLHLSPDGAIGRPSLLPSTAPVMGGLFMDATGDRPRFFLHGKEQEEEVEEEEVVGKSTPGSREVDNHAVVVAVKACGLSPVPCALLARLKMQQSPQAVGREVAGMVAAVGALVTFFKPGDEVVGILPLDCTESGLAPRVTVHEHCLVLRPSGVDCVEAAACVRDGMVATAALQGLAGAGAAVLVTDAATSVGVAICQLAQHRGAKVVAAVGPGVDRETLDQLWPQSARVVELGVGGGNLVASCLEETGGLGVDLVVDAGVRASSTGGAPPAPGSPRKHDLLSALAVAGQWVTTHELLQLDPPDCALLQLKGASVRFLNEELWSLSPTRRGRHLHGLRDVMEKLSAGVFRPFMHRAEGLGQAVEAMTAVQAGRSQLKRVVQL
uniref:Quinone oxidoreductase-like protein 1 isoform X4 n=1 Tax=Petromyzon marinus TaxID=7757 RepID=A0AAJ7XC79_PETMA|nr:quinone oxidoreductase-like protein 1 isoform X4 [Petromyzon marinus]